MKKLSFAIFLSIFFVIACNNPQTHYTQNVNDLLGKYKMPTLAGFIEQANPVVLEDDFPPIIIAPLVKEDLNSDLVIDIRSKDDYESGHINGAYNVPAADLINFLNNINVSTYQNIVLVCYSGQTATYNAELLRMLGYKNVFSMAYGMAGWNRDFSDIFKRNISAKYINQISRVDVPLPEKSSLPDLEIGLPLDVLRNRVVEAMSLKPSEYLVSADQVFAGPEKYFIIDLRRPEHYKIGHIPGAVNIRPNELLLSEKLEYLPKNKPIVLYCYHGYTSAATTAYLRVLGYEAYSLKFGYHSFMDGILNKRIDFNTAFNDFPFITGDKRVDIRVSQTQTQQVKKPAITVPVKKKQVGGGCE